MLNCYRFYTDGKHFLFWIKHSSTFCLTFDKWLYFTFYTHFRRQVWVFVFRRMKDKVYLSINLRIQNLCLVWNLYRNKDRQSQPVTFKIISMFTQPHEQILFIRRLITYLHTHLSKTRTAKKELCCTYIFTWINLSLSSKPCEFEKRIKWGASGSLAPPH